MVREENVLNQDHVLYHFMKFVKTFLNSSHIHGLRYLTDKEMSVSGRLFWLIVVSISVTCSALLVYDVATISTVNPIEFSVDEKIWTSSDVNLIFFNSKHLYNPRLLSRCHSQRLWSPFKSIGKSMSITMLAWETTSVPASTTRWSRCEMATKTNQNISKLKTRCSLRDPVLGPQHLKPVRFLVQAGLDQRYDQRSYTKNGYKYEFVSPILPKFRTFTSPELITNQSFCYESFSEVLFTETLTDYGLGYYFNHNPNLLKHEKYFFCNFSEIFSNVLKIIFLPVLARILLKTKAWKQDVRREKSCGTEKRCRLHCKEQREKLS